MSRPTQSARSSFQIISDDPISWVLLSYCPRREHSLSASPHRPDFAPVSLRHQNLPNLCTYRLLRNTFHQDLPNCCTYRLLRHTCHQELPKCCTYRLLRHTCHQDLPNCCTYLLLFQTFLSLCSKLTNTNGRHGFY
jgi:hypothetical protein